MEGAGIRAPETGPDRGTGEELPLGEPAKGAAADNADTTKYTKWSVDDGGSTGHRHEQGPSRQPAPPATQSPSVSCTRRDNYVYPVVPPGPPAPTDQEEEAVGSGYVPAADYHGEAPWVSVDPHNNNARYSAGQSLHQFHIQQQQQQQQQLQLQLQRQAHSYTAPLWSPTYPGTPLAFAGPPGFEDPRFYNLVPPGLPCAIITERVETSENTAYVVANGLDDVWNKTLDGLIVGMRSLKNAICANTVFPGTNEMDDVGIVVRAMDASQALAGVLRLHANYAMMFRSIPTSNPTFDDNPALFGADRRLAVKEFNTYRREKQKVRQLI